MICKLKLRVWAAAIFVVALCDFPGIAHGQANDPIGIWDVNISGSVTGLGRIAFVGDGTIDPLNTFIVVRATPGVKSTKFPTGVAVSAATPATGGWSFDSKGKSILGFLSGGIASAPYDMSFTGKAKIGINSSISLIAKGSDGSWRIAGVPATDDGGMLDGSNWTAQGTKDGAPFVELFHLRSDICPDDPPPPVETDCVGPRFTSTNIYELYGSGPGYLTQGYVLVGAGGKIGIGLTEYLVDKDTGEVANDGVTRIITGRFFSTANGFQTNNLTGVDDNHLNVKMNAFGN